MKEEILHNLPVVDLGMDDVGGDIAARIDGDQAAKQATMIKVKPIYEITRGGCQCLGFMQYKLDGFDSASYMQMLSDPATMQTIKEVYYSPKQLPQEDVGIIEHPELPLEY